MYAYPHNHKTHKACTTHTYKHHTCTTHSGVTDVHPVGVESGLHLVGVVDVQQVRSTKLAGLSSTTMVMMMILHSVCTHGQQHNLCIHLSSTYCIHVNNIQCCTHLLTRQHIYTFILTYCTRQQHIAMYTLVNSILYLHTYVFINYNCTYLSATYCTHPQQHTVHYSHW